MSVQWITPCPSPSARESLLLLLFFSHGFGKRLKGTDDDVSGLVNREIS